ncbi:glycosyltransferase family 4 protein [Urechidicola croceus]|nr:glycosyltransferase family 4 protein [Urechidicola croceus]
MAITIANSLVKYDVESYLCATRSEGNLKLKINSEVNYFFLDRKRTVDISSIIRLKKIIKKNKIDIIHTHSSSYFIATLVKLIYPKVKIVWHDHYGNCEMINSRKVQPIKLFSRFFKEIIAVNNLLKNWSKNTLKFPRVYYLPNYASFNNSKFKTDLKGIEGKRLVCVAGLRPQKDHLNLLKAFKLINYNHKDWTLHLVGNKYDDEYYLSLKKFIHTNGFQDVVFLYHDSIDIENILAQSTIGILSSKSEGLPVSLLEYGLAKLPVVVTDVGECSNVVTNNENGFVVEKENEQFLADKIDFLIKEEKLRKEFSIKFHKHILDNYSEQEIIHRLLKIYNS